MTEAITYEQFTTALLAYKEDTRKNPRGPASKNMDENYGGCEYVVDTDEGVKHCVIGQVLSDLGVEVKREWGTFSFRNLIDGVCIEDDADEESITDLFAPDDVQGIRRLGDNVQSAADGGHPWNVAISIGFQG